jgi:hypothetical protein
MTRVSIALLAVMAAIIAVTSCKPPTDLNRPCRLVKRNPDGGDGVVPILEGEVKANAGHGKDFISIGTVDCDDLICVRDSLLETDAGPFDPAYGYCSRECLEGAVCPSYDSSLDTTANKLNCRALLLDKETLAGLVGADGGSPGNVRDPFFCARGETPDAGI